MKKHLIFFACILLSTLTIAQSETPTFSKPLKDVLNEIQTKFNVKLKIPDGLVTTQVLPYADTRLRRYSVEESLKNVLAPFDLIYVKQNDSLYKVKPYNRALRSADDGYKELHYLTDNVYTSKEAWEKHAKDLKPAIEQALQINNMPANPHKKPLFTPERIMNGYQVQNFALETVPGVYVCGSIYKPLKAKGKLPLIITPNGHFVDGRYRKSEQIRCALFARMGAYVVTYDLFAWGESLLQFNAEAHHTPMAQTMQILNGERIIDYFSTLKIIDSTRIAITGGSSGGSQTMQLTAIDNRIKVVAPVVMVSSYFNGGCMCESGCPIHQCCGGMNNAELAALAAPRPMLIVSDGKDWTQNVPQLEYPFIKYIYNFYNASALLTNQHFPNEGHDYGESKRKAVYPFLAHYLHLNLGAIENEQGAIDESTCTVEEYSKLYAFGPHGEHLPANAIKGLNALYQICPQITRYK